MADTPDEPKTETPKPAAPRRAPRKANAKTPAPRGAGATPTARASTTKSEASPPKPTSKAPKPRSSKRSTPRASAKPVNKKGQDTSDTSRGKWGVAAIAGGLAAAGAAAAALLTLRGSATKPKSGDRLQPSDKGAHQIDGQDSTKSFEAGIVDEGTIPN